MGLNYEDGQIPLSAHFVTTLNTVSLFRYAVLFQVEFKA